MITFPAKINMMTDKLLMRQGCALGTYDSGLHTVLIKHIVVT